MGDHQIFAIFTSLNKNASLNNCFIQTIWLFETLNISFCINKAQTHHVQCRVCESTAKYFQYYIHWNRKLFTEFEVARYYLKCFTRSLYNFQRLHCVSLYLRIDDFDRNRNFSQQFLVLVSNLLNVLQNKKHYAYALRVQGTYHQTM